MPDTHVTEDMPKDSPTAARPAETPSADTRLADVQPADTRRPEARRSDARHTDTQRPKAYRAEDFPGLSLEVTAFTQSQLAFAEAPQVALAGRSNVGKSSLVNALAGRKKLAKISSTPGKTRSINYYRVGKSEAFLVDLPGYGYAQCSQKERDAWAELLRRYLAGTPGLKALILLLDARLPPQKSDRELVAYAAALGLPLTPVLTKADKCSKKELAATARAWGALLDAKSLISCSAQARTGLERIWAILLDSLEKR